MNRREGILEVLQRYWGFPSFRSLQEDIILSVLDGKDTLALLPTGGGKSICFQVPALYQEGICIVISPLIALMKDQVSNLISRGINAIAIHSGLSYQDIDRLLDNCIYGDVKFLYLSPERLQSELTIERLKQMKVNLIAIDEAHCISQWGYDFRPPYLKIADLKNLFPSIPFLALTATATPDVVIDIQEKLLFPQKNVIQKSFARSNLSYSVFEEENKYAKLLKILHNVSGTSIVYVRSRKLTKTISTFLIKNGISAAYYHAGLSTLDREKIQEAWIENKIRVMVSTNAFGMGIDKPNVRSVVHVSIPENLEAYFQEAGRAGRDEKKAYAVLLYDESDIEKMHFYYQSSFPKLKEIRKVYRSLGAYFQLANGSQPTHSFDFDIFEFVDIYDLEIIATLSALKTLEQAGWLIMTEAVYSPSTLKFVLDNEGVYDFQLRNRKFELLIKRILQTYQGAFNHHVKIFENRLAIMANMEIGEVFKALQYLSKNAIIDYRPYKDKPQIIFLREKVPASHLTFDDAFLDFRKKRYKAKMDAILQYVSVPICRSMQLLQYFGEKGKECGVCDVCLGRTQAFIKTKDYTLLKNRIIQLLQEHPYSLEKLLTAFSDNQVDKLLITLRYMEEEGIIRTHNQLISFTQPDTKDE